MKKAICPGEYQLLQTIGCEYRVGICQLKIRIVDLQASIVGGSLYVRNRKANCKEHGVSLTGAA